MSHASGTSTVLVIDESDAWFSAVASECQKHGYQAIRARHRDEALHAAQDQRPSLVMVDLLLAAKAGAGFIRQLRSIPALKDTPMLLATSGTDPHRAQQAVGGTRAEVVAKNRRSLDAVMERLKAQPVSA